MVLNYVKFTCIVKTKVIFLIYELVSKFASICFRENIMCFNLLF